MSQPDTPKTTAATNGNDERAPDTGPHARPTGPAPTDTGPAATKHDGADQHGASSPQAAPWERDGTEFDAERAWRLIQRLRAELAGAKAPSPDTADAAVRQPDTDNVGLRDHVSRLEAQLARERVARRHGLPDELVDLLGEGSEDDIAARATALIQWAGTDKQLRPGVSYPVGDGMPDVAPKGGALPDTDTTRPDPEAIANEVRNRRSMLDIYVAVRALRLWRAASPQHPT